MHSQCVSSSSAGAENFRQAPAVASSPSTALTVKKVFGQRRRVQPQQSQAANQQGDLAAKRQQHGPGAAGVLPLPPVVAAVAALICEAQRRGLLISASISSKAR